MESIPCDLCGSENSKAIFDQTDLLHGATKERFTMARCSSCSLLFLNPRPTAEEMGKYYPETYYAHERKNRFRDTLRSMLRRIVNLACVGQTPSLPRFLANIALLPLRLPGLGSRLPNLIVPEVRAYIDVDRPGKILDVGCGAGQEVHVFGPRVGILNLSRRGWDACAVESSLQARKILRANGIESAFENFEEAQFPSDSFDVVRLSWSLEHVPSPMKVLLECRRVLKPGGRLIVGVPNYGGLIYKIFPTCVEVPVHTYYFTVDTFKRYCDKLGIKIIDYYTFSHVPLLLEAMRIMGRSDLHAYYLSNPGEAMRLQSFLDFAGESGMGDDMVFCLTKD
ncbi:MAG: hypothetical protein COV48_10935 [Elusimicrobia bacterium CG11_big_fil_rev_8_21_14_0_20_64_6]|nr:MAG: hypothetical protein COV48_10935 [Elusimicrobia bacterium CG11_big_fil_rev_8_21_14_0_20_64_6]